MVSCYTAGARTDSETEYRLVVSKYTCHSSGEDVTTFKIMATKDGNNWGK